MAGDGNYLKHDAAIERWGSMRDGVYKHFQFTRRTSWISFIGVALVPLSLYWVAASEDTKWNWVGKRKGESLQRVPPPNIEAAEQ